MVYNNESTGMKLTKFDYNEDMKQYKSAEDVYKKFGVLRNLNKNDICQLGLICHQSNNIHDLEFASACRALIILDKTKFK